MEKKWSSSVQGSRDWRLPMNSWPKTQLFKSLFLKPWIALGEKLTPKRFEALSLILALSLSVSHKNTSLTWQSGPNNSSCPKSTKAPKFYTWMARETLTLQTYLETWTFWPWCKCNGSSGKLTEWLKKFLYSTPETAKWLTTGIV